ncbi:hypothetical protein [Bacillus toyonensis]|uniref:hypothetical protein n=1 Tax=Bacillus toyonensis TaxID=155322 RepID=UPI002E1DC054|nr:hypothetical protein [Bacillus toyonensis]
MKEIVEFLSEYGLGFKKYNSIKDIEKAFFHRLWVVRSEEIEEDITMLINEFIFDLGGLWIDNPILIGIEVEGVIDSNQLKNFFSKFRMDYRILAEDFSPSYIHSGDYGLIPINELIEEYRGLVYYLYPSWEIQEVFISEELKPKIFADMVFRELMKKIEDRDVNIHFRSLIKSIVKEKKRNKL